MEKIADLTAEAMTAAEDLLPQAQKAITAHSLALLKLLEEKRNLSWIQFATD